MGYAPRGLGPAGRRLWRSVLDQYELEEHERVLLVEACRTADTCTRLEEAAADLDTGPVLVELRQQRLTLFKLISALRLPAGLTGEAPPRGSAFRNRAPSLRNT